MRLNKTVHATVGFLSSEKLTFLVFLCWSFFGISQLPTDYQLWTGFNYQLKVSKKFTVNVAPEIRFKDTISRIGSIFPDLGVKYKLSKNIDFKLGYRYSIRPGSNSKNRINLDFNYDFKKKGSPFSFSNRVRFQFARTSNSGKTESFLREQIQMGYNLSKLVDPFVSFEIFFKFGNNEFRNLRSSIGFDWKISKHWSASTFYILQREIFVGSPTRDHIFGISGKYDMKLKKKKSQASID